MRPKVGKRNSPGFFHISHVLCMSNLRDMPDIKSISTSAHTRCSTSRLISEMEAMIRLQISYRSCGRDGGKTESLECLHKKQ